MKYSEFNKMLSDGANKLDVKLNDSQKELFYKFMNMVLEKNKHLNLTSIKEPKEFVNKHILDSLAIVPYVKESKTIADVGTGAGFPGIPIKICMPDVKLTLIDSVNKKLTFLKEVINELNLKKIECIHSRAEDAGQNPSLRGKYDCSVARAVAKLPVLLEYCMPFLKQDGMFVAMKSGKIKEEMETCENALDKLNGTLNKTVRLTLPYNNIERSLIIYNLHDEIPKKYPRRAGTPSKKPL